MCTTNALTPLHTIAIQSSKVKVITWTVNFDRKSIQECVESVESEQFRFSGIMWKMCLDIATPTKYTGIKCYLKVTDCSYPADVGHIILALDSSGDIVCSWGKRPKKDAESGKSVSSADDIVKTFELPSRVISDGFLTLCCQLIPDEVYFEKQLKMLEQEQSTDVVISFGKKHLKAHNFMLAAHSHTFNDMLNTEKQESQLKLTDFDYEVVKEMLTFIYTKRLPNLEKLAVGLLRIDDKYNIKGLRERCEESFCESISTNNAIRLQALAEHHNLSQLKDRVRVFIECNLKAVQESVDWKTLMQKCYSDLIIRNCVQNFDRTEKEGQPASKKPKLPKDRNTTLTFKSNMGKFY
ncbi:uncharacterized protein LOC109397344 [Aedes albopictus]|uniref:BTB domain-containing protein n=1 Tax=Aedes albopictus TaxID=7160 RepID=A0ABM1ZG03_AEDAL